MTLRLAAAVTDALAAPAPAQDSATILDLYAARCAAIAADPEEAVNAAFGPDTETGDASGAVTSDGALLQYTEQMALPGDLRAIFFYRRTRTDGGDEAGCTLTVPFFSADKVPGMADLGALIDSRVEAIPGAPAIRHGGGVMQDGEIGRLVLWTAGPGFPDPARRTLSQEAAT